MCFSAFERDGACLIKGAVLGDIMIFGQNSLNLNFEHCVNFLIANLKKCQ